MDGHDQLTVPQSNFSQVFATRVEKWRRWQKEAEAVWKDHPNLSRHSVGRLIKRRLQVSEQADSIARRIRKRVELG
jgi:hypothetical protein